MKKFPLLLLAAALSLPMAARERTAVSLQCSPDSAYSVTFDNNSFRYDGMTVELGPKSFLVAGALTDEEAARSPYLFRTFQEAIASLTPGTEAEPMTVYVAPYVYWIDDPDDPQVRLGWDGHEPFGMEINCPYLHLIGLNPHPENTVLASNRGQTQGAVGNFTMFNFIGDGLMVKNMTLGNFCNVDLNYPLNPSLSRPKRMSAITQAHVAYCHGDKILAENVRFISRLNMNPLNGAKRILFVRCHMESTDDALTGTGVYLECSLDFWGQRPFWCSDKGGAIFLNCDFNICHDGQRQYFCKSVGPLSIIDSRYHSKGAVYAGWTHTPTDWLRCYQYGVTFEGQPYVIGGDKPYNTICMDQLPALEAYRLQGEEGALYNTYNLLRGEDDWDPLHVKERVVALAQRDGKNYTDRATCLLMSEKAATLQTGEEPLTVSATLMRPVHVVLHNEPVKWRVQKGYEKYLQLSVTEGERCVLTPTNHDETAKHFSVIAYTESGLEGAVELTVAPDYVEAPAFVKEPTLQVAQGVVTVNYELALEGRADESLITWYRCSDRNGANAIPVVVSRNCHPEQTYTLSREDVNSYLMAEIQPKHLRCLPGEAHRVVMQRPVKAKEVKQPYALATNFRTFPADNQPQRLPGYWTVDGYKPLDTAEFDWTILPDKNYWYYGTGLNGAQGEGLVQALKGARLLYTPLEGTYGDMDVQLLVDPAKTAGQGFGSATGQYLDLCLKFDTETLTGYALRVIRTTKYSNAVDFVLVKYEQGKTTEICEPVSSPCFRTGCTLHVWSVGNRLYAHVETTTELSLARTPGLLPTVDLEAEMTSNSFGGVAIQHTGTVGEGATMLHQLNVRWK